MQIGSTGPYLPPTTAPLPTATRAASAAGNDPFATALAAVPTDASPAATVRQSASDPAGRRTLSHLTAGDRDLIRKAFGVTLTADGADLQGRTLAPMMAWTIAVDREHGRLPAGQPVTAAYLTEMRDRYASHASSAAASMIGQIDALIAVVNRATLRDPADAHG